VHPGSADAVSYKEVRGMPQLRASPRLDGPRTTRFAAGGLR